MTDKKPDAYWGDVPIYADQNVPNGPPFYGAYMVQENKKPDELPWLEITHDSGDGDQPGYFVPEYEALELWELKQNLHKMKQTDIENYRERKALRERVRLFEEAAKILRMFDTFTGNCIFTDDERRRALRAEWYSGMDKLLLAMERKK